MGDYVLSVDDDSWFVEPDGLARAVAFLDSHVDVAAVACNIETKDGLVYFPKAAAPFDAPWYVGCGHLLRRSAVESVGLYMPELYRQGEEKDRCLRLLGAGYRVVALPDVMVFHDKSEKGRKPGLERFYNHRNDLIREIARRAAALAVRAQLDRQQLEESAPRPAPDRPEGDPRPAGDRPNRTEAPRPGGCGGLPALAASGRHRGAGAGWGWRAQPHHASQDRLTPKACPLPDPPPLRRGGKQACNGSA